MQDIDEMGGVGPALSALPTSDDEISVAASDPDLSWTSWTVTRANVTE